MALNANVKGNKEAVVRLCETCQTRYDASLRFCPRDGKRLVAVPNPDTRVGSLVDGRYRLQDQIGSGAFGLVYRARHDRLPRDLAVKLLTSEVSAHSPWVSRFEREVRAQALLKHPHIVDVYDFGWDPAVGYYIAMDLLEGEDLGQRLERKPPLHILDIYAIMQQAGSALAAAHRADIVHRDIKPENVFLAKSASGGRPHVKLLDFGVAQLDVPGYGSDELGEGSGYVCGSPYSMAPEQIQGLRVDGRADIYSLGIVLYEMLTGSVPFVGATVREVWSGHLNDRPAPPSSVPGCEWIVPELDAVVLWMLSKDPDDRPATADEATEALEYVRGRVEDAWASFHLTAAGRETARAAAVRGLPAETLEGWSEPRRVLVVDDEALFHSLVRRTLARHGYECLAAHDAREARAMLAAEEAPPYAILVDILMPDIDGLTLIGQLRHLGYAGPIVVCSALTAPTVVEEALRRGAARVLCKPDQLQELATVLNAFADKAPVSKRGKRLKVVRSG